MNQIIVMTALKNSDQDLGSCEYYCNGENKAVTEVWYKKICDTCFRRLVKETTEAVSEELKQDENNKVAV
jgi:hypothetical protein